ncbi:ubiquitin carboxyl-terminal hydrolase 16 [Ambystoma mexicanum]|uniref:ubiquitin carboxyl-terminal hydrolase 16 n=1 Tax=Ambystoma mexicanum TaxID=8296 RepID=UPI0037E7B095
MAKKRTKSKAAQANEPTDNLEHSCTHIRKGLEQGNLKRALPEVEWNTCQDCQTDNEAKENIEEEIDIPSVWLCLKCGHRGCDRNSQEKHALQHYNTPRSDCHCLVLNLDNWSVWCYLCDDEVPYSSSNRLGQLVDYVRKETNKKACVQNSKSDLKEQEKNMLENKKLEKDSKNEKEKVKNNSEHNEEKQIVSLDAKADVVVKGFSNLGNTCFFNAVMQNLSQTPVLRELLKEVKMTGRTVTVESLDSPPNEPWVIKLEQLPGALTSSMCHFLADIEETKNGTVTPKELFSQVCKKAIRFRGYQQQDSQELLRYLLDGMRAEEIQRLKFGIIKSMKNSTQKIEDEEEIKRKTNEYEKKRAIPNFVDRIFGGELSSTVLCEECRTVSLVHETFLDLSLSVLDEQTVKKSALQKNATVVSQNENDDDDNDTYLKEKNDASSGTSKHLLKKAKKQAKKQGKIQRRQHKVLQLSDLAPAERPSETHENGYEETSVKDTQLENDHNKEAVEGLIESVEHGLILQNAVNEEKETDTLSSSVSGSPEQYGVIAVRETVSTLETLGTSNDKTNGCNILDGVSTNAEEGILPLEICSSSCLETVSICGGEEKHSPCLERNNRDLECGSQYLKMNSQVLEGRPFLGIGKTFSTESSPPGLNKVNLCSAGGSTFLEENSSPWLGKDGLCLENGSPLLEKSNKSVDNDSLCLDEVRSFLGEGSPDLEERSQCLKECNPVLEEGNSCLDRRRPRIEAGSPHSKCGLPSLGEGSPSLDSSSSSLEKDSPKLERDGKSIGDLVDDFDELLLRAFTEPSNGHDDSLNSVGHTAQSKLYEVVNEDPETAFCTLADRAAINTEECSVESCLYQFTRNEKLSENNKLLCNVCTRKQCNRKNFTTKGEVKHVYTNAKKQMLISLAPPILTLHLKRFQQAGANLRKVNRHVTFPELIDLAPFCTVKCKNVAEGHSKVLYSLYGVVEHSGTMRSGHYTAFVKARRSNTRLSDLVIRNVIPQVLLTEPPKGQWYHISDTHVQTVPLNRVLNSQAYLLFYERIL